MLTCITFIQRVIEQSDNQTGRFFLQEVVLQDHLFQMCYNSHEKSKYILILKNEKPIYMSHSE